MDEKILNTQYGDVHYYIDKISDDAPWLVFLPGLTADYHLFDKQIEFFKGKYNLLAWDAPAHGASRPFELKFTLFDMAQYLHNIFKKEGVEKPFLIGQSLGGYVSQVYMEMFKGAAAGFISIDSAPLQKKYYTSLDLAMLCHTTGMYLCIPWKLLIKWAADGLAMSAYGREYMRELMSTYARREYCYLAGYGFRILADAVGMNRAYKIDCPALLLCGEADAAGYAKRYNREWTKNMGFKLIWLANAGHNANTDAPDEVNELIDEFVKSNTSKA